jgi:cytochrome c-type biogenesis protein CcmH/NrfG
MPVQALSTELAQSWHMEGMDQLVTQLRQKLQHHNITGGLRRLGKG